jgi:hypothetical protein
MSCVKVAKPADNLPDFHIQQTILQRGFEYTRSAKRAVVAAAKYHYCLSSLRYFSSAPCLCLTDFRQTSKQRAGPMAAGSEAVGHSVAGSSPPEDMAFVRGLSALCCPA